MNRLLTLMLHHHSLQLYVRGQIYQLNLDRSFFDYLVSVSIVTTDGTTNARSQYFYSTTITYRNAKINDSYGLAVSHTQLEVKKHNDQYSFLIQISSKVSASFQISLSCLCDHWRKLTIRYLVVMKSKMLPKIIPQETGI